MCENDSFIRQRITNIAQKEIGQFGIVKSLSFKFLPNQLSKIKQTEDDDKAVRQ